MHTSGGLFPARYIIHAVAPSGQEQYGINHTFELYKECITNILNEAHCLGDVSSLSIPDLKIKIIEEDMLLYRMTDFT